MWISQKYPKVLLDQIPRGTLRQPRGQRLRLRCHLLFPAFLRGGGGGAGGEVVTSYDM